MIPRERGCIDRPACLYLRNVLTVTATDFSDKADPAAPVDPTYVAGCPKLLVGMSAGEGVDIAAPGENIVSTIVRDMTGPLSGSSQATPIVAGSASLLFAKNLELDALTVKNRLIYSADICPNLKVLGGLLNVKRALEFDASRVLLADGSEVSGHFADSLADFVFYDFTKQSQIRISLQALKRLYRLPSGDFVFLYHNAQPGPRIEKEPLTRAIGQVRSGSFRFLVNGDPNNGRTINLADATDYLSRIESIAP
jgi:hypothetical protein